MANIRQRSSPGGNLRQRSFSGGGPGGGPGASNARPERRDKDRKKSEHHHDKDHKPHHKPGKKPGGGSATEDIKAMSTQSGQDALNATPGQHPANDEAVFTTGPGLAVEYNYTRLGTYSEDYARQQSVEFAPVPPIAGQGQVLTRAASGAENNPT